MTEAIYKKVGRRYVQIGVFDEERGFYPHGAHLVLCKDSERLTRFRIDPDYANALAAMKVARDAMMAAINEVNVRELVTPERLNAKQKRLLTEAKLDRLVWTGPSASDIAEAGINAVIKKMKEAK